MTTESYSINATTLAPAKLVGDQWENVVDLAEHEGNIVLLTSAGLYDLSTEGSVATKFRTGKLKLAGGQPFNIFKVLMLLRASAPVQVTLYAEDSGTENTYGPYSFELFERDSLREYWVRTGQGHRGTSYMIEISCTGYMELGNMEIYYVPASRRFKNA
jgi:hypothetical protein